jgi:hypothetical protein
MKVEDQTALSFLVLLFICYLLFHFVRRDFLLPCFLHIIYTFVSHIFTHCILHLSLVLLQVYLMM